VARPCPAMIKINEELQIPESEVEFTFSPSSKPGGQHVNKVSTRVTLVFDVDGSTSLSESQRDRIKTRLRGRLTRDGLLRVVAQRHRSQHANREAAKERCGELLRAALRRRAKRRKTVISREAHEQRLRAKRRRALVKRRRAAVPDGDD
jgi:ribosome-associated protein